MIRLNRVGRERAILDAIRKLKSKGRYASFTQGEICKQMGITSQSKIRDILRDMCQRGLLDCGTSAIDGYSHEIAIYSIAANQQTELPNHTININGVVCDMATGMEIKQYVSV